MSNRICGGCTACCKTHGVRSISKPPKVTCPHVCATGCACYETRPVECVDFRCMWLSGFGGEDFRPDRVGFVALFTVFYGESGNDRLATLSLWEYREGALRSEVAVRFTLNNLSVGNCVFHVPDKLAPILYLGKGRVGIGVLVAGEKDEEVLILSYEDALRSLTQGLV